MNRFFGDEFLGTTLDPSKWDEPNNPTRTTVGSGYLSFLPGSTGDPTFDNFARIYSIELFNFEGRYIQFDFLDFPTLQAGEIIQFDFSADVAPFDSINLMIKSGGVLTTNLYIDATATDTIENINYTGIIEGVRFESLPTTEVELFLKISGVWQKYQTYEESGAFANTLFYVMNHNSLNNVTPSELKLERILTNLHIPGIPVLNVTVDVSPSFKSSSGFYQYYTARLKADATEIPISDFTLNAERDKIGFQLEVTLSRPDDKSLITYDKDFTFEIGLVHRVTGAITWDTLLSLGKLKSKNFSIAWGQDSPSDSVTFSADSDLDDKLTKSPTGNFVIYDPTDQELTVNDFETIYDNNGAAYSTTLTELYGLTLYQIFQRVFETECGFTSYKTNIPDFRIKRIDFNITSNYLSSVSPLIGMFEPVFFVVDNILWILDTTQAIPTGFPDPEELTVDDYKSVSASYSQDKIDAIIMDYLGTDSEFDYIQTRIETRTESSGVFGEEDFTETDYVETYYDYFKNGTPGILVRSNLRTATEHLVNNIFETIGDKSVVHRYDGLGREVGSTSTIVGLVPALNGSSAETLTTVFIEEFSITYGPHPFKPGQDIQLKSSRRQRGLVAVDTENQYLGQDFKQPLLEAHRAGNLIAEMETTFGPIMTVEEQVSVIDNNQVRVKTRTTDHVRNLVTNDTSEPKTADVSIRQNATKTKPMLILPEGVTSLTGKRIEKFSIGEVPLDIGIALAKRRIDKLVNKPYTFSAGLIGYVRGLRRGLTKTIEDRSGTKIGVMIIEGFAISGNNLGQEGSDFTTTFQGVQV